MSISLSKWPMLPTIAWCFMLRHVAGEDDVLVAGGGDEDVGGVDDGFEGVDLEARHRGLEGADRVDLGDDDPGALTGERLGAALADVAVAADDGDLAADHDVGGSVDAVDEAVPASVQVVELRLGDRVVDVDRRETTGSPFFLHLVEAVDAGRGLLGHAADAGGDLREELGVVGEDRADSVRETPPTLRGRPRSASGTEPAFSNSRPLCTSMVASPPSSRIRFGPSPSGHRKSCSVAHQYSSSVSPFQAKTGCRSGHRGCRRGRPPLPRRRGPGSRRCCS